MVDTKHQEISVIINAYKRTELLKDQLDAIEKQTIKPKKIYVWQNKGGEIDTTLKSRFTLIQCSENFGVWARFSFALNLDTEFICIFDDDTIPGRMWFENCLNTAKNFDGLFGTRGLRFLSTESYSPFKHYGWGNPNEDVVKVDIVGHSWFFKREYLSMFWSEPLPLEISKTSGEDINFSYMLQKFGFGTYVPPHPKNNQDLWGSLPIYGEKYGSDNRGISSMSNSQDKFNFALRHYVKKGFKLYLHSDSSGVVISKSIRSNQNLKNLIKKNSKIKSIANWLIRKLEKIGLHI